MDNFVKRPRPITITAGSVTITDTYYDLIPHVAFVDYDGKRRVSHLYSRREVARMIRFYRRERGLVKLSR